MEAGGSKEAFVFDTFVNPKESSNFALLILREGFSQHDLYMLAIDGYLIVSIDIEQLGYESRYEDIAVLVLNMGTPTGKEAVESADTVLNIPGRGYATAMEGTEGKLGSRLTEALGRQDTDRSTFSD